MPINKIINYTEHLVVKTPYAFSLVIALIIIVFISALFFKKEASFQKGIKANVLALVFLLICEVFFAYFHINSDSFGFTLSGKRWFYLYWNPINSLGVRDAEPAFSDPHILLIGDSFAAGQGIQNIQDRFGNQLEEKLSDINIVLAAKNGWSTKDAINLLNAYPYKPKAVIISYVLNDIDNAAKEFGLKEYSYQNGPQNFLARVFVNHSYFINWTYWQLIRQHINSSLQTNDEHYINYYEQAYSNKNILLMHAQELKTLSIKIRNLNAQGFFLIWPNLADVQGSSHVTKAIRELVETTDMTIIDMTPFLLEMNRKQLIINYMDFHPSIEAHTLAATVLFQALSSQAEEGSGI